MESGEVRTRLEMGLEKGAAWFSALVLSCSVMIDSFATPWTAAHQAPLFMRLSRQEYWSQLPLPPLGDDLGYGCLNLKARY